MTDTEFEGTTLDGTDSVAATERRGSVLVESRDNMPARQRAVPGRTRPTEVSENLPEIGGPVAGAETTQATGQNAFVSAELARSGAGRDRASRLEFGLPRERRFRSPVRNPLVRGRFDLPSWRAALGGRLQPVPSGAVCRDSWRGEANAQDGHGSGRSPVIDWTFDRRQVGGGGRTRPWTSHNQPRLQIHERPLGSA